MKKLTWIVITLWTAACAHAQAPAPAEPQADAPQAAKAETAAPEAAVSAPAPATGDGPSSASASRGDETAVPSSIEYVGADIQDVLRTLARQAGLNLVMAEDVTGKVTISLTDVPYEKAIKLIVESKGYIMLKEDNILKVQSKASMAAEPLQEEIITLQFTTAEEAERVLRPLLTPNRGTIQADARSNTIIISDVSARLAQLREVVARIDTQTPQVMIEARILETTKNPRQDYGIRWDSLRNYSVGVRNIGYKWNPVTGGVNKYTGGDPTAPIKDADVAVLSADDFKLLISFLNSNGETELIASPRVVTADNKEAQIAIAEQWPIPQFTFNQQTASLEVSGFQFKDIGILLRVTPHINNSGYVTLELKPEVSDFDPNQVQTFGGAVEARIPVIKTRNMHASVMIKDGHTLALGGLIQEGIRNSYTKVPVMGDIPGIGAAFRSKSFEKAKRNLLIFITPTVVGPEGTTGLEDQYSGLKHSPDDDFANPKGWRDNGLPRSENLRRAQGASAGK